MSRFFVGALVGLTMIAATISASASAYECLASSANGASGRGWGFFARSNAMHKCVSAGGNLMGHSCHILYCRP